MFALSHKAIDCGEWRAKLEFPDCGAVATFEGLVRNHHQGRPVTDLRYHAHEPLAIAIGSDILAQACEKFDVREIFAVHRLGQLVIGECAIWIGVAAAHRQAAFDAVRYCIDTLKSEVPIYKHESFADGSTQWVNGLVDLASE